MLNSKWDNQPEAYAKLRDCWLNRRRLAHVRDFLAEAREGQVVLEIGSGTGGLLSELSRLRPDLEFHGVEPQRDYVEYSRSQAPQARFHVGFAESIPDEVPAPDLILTNDAIHHWSDVEQAIRGISSRARPGARWLAVEPNSLNPYVLLGQTLKKGERNFRPGAFVASARQSGWALVRRRFLFLIPPFWREPPEIAKSVERGLEGIAPLAGGISLEMRLSQ